MTSVTKTISNIELGVEPISAKYLSQSRELEIIFNTGARYLWPVDSLQMIEKTSNGWETIPKPTDAQLSKVRLWPHKEVVEFSNIEQCFEISSLIRGQLGSKKWMHELLNQ